MARKDYLSEWDQVSDYYLQQYKSLQLFTSLITTNTNIFRSIKVIETPVHIFIQTHKLLKMPNLLKLFVKLKVFIVLSLMIWRRLFHWHFSSIFSLAYIIVWHFLFLTNALKLFPWVTTSFSKAKLLILYPKFWVPSVGPCLAIPSRK